MKKLTRHTNFVALKSAHSPVKLNSVSNKRVMSEFETFISLLQHELSIKKNSKASHGKNLKT